MPTKIRVQRERIQKAALEAFDASKFDNTIMQVGVVDESLAYPDGTRVVDVAMWNEFGTDTIPARPALRTALKKIAPTLAKIGTEQAKQMLAGKLRFDHATRRLAKLLAGAMQESIEKWRRPPNAESTVARKGFNDPLIETGLYVNSIDFKLLKTRKSQL